MAFTAGDVIMAARDMNPALSPERHPDPVCWRFLTRYTRTLAAKIAAVRTRALTTTVVSADLPLAVFANGVPIPNDLLLIEVEARPRTRTDDTVRVPVELLPAGRHASPQTRGPWTYRDGAVLYLGGTARAWDFADRVDLRILAMPAAITGHSTALPFQDDALDVCCLSVAAFLMGRVAAAADGEKVAPAPLTALALEAEAAYLARLTMQRGSEVFTIRQVWD